MRWDGSYIHILLNIPWSPMKKPLSEVVNDDRVVPPGGAVDMIEQPADVLIERRHQPQVALDEDLVESPRSVRPSPPATTRATRGTAPSGN